jgi:hypothetical protein
MTGKGKMSDAVIAAAASSKLVGAGPAPYLRRDSSLPLAQAEGDNPVFFLKSLEK